MSTPDSENPLNTTLGVTTTSYQQIDSKSPNSHFFASTYSSPFSVSQALPPGCQLFVGAPTTTYSGWFTRPGYLLISDEFDPTEVSNLIESSAIQPLLSAVSSTHPSASLQAQHHQSPQASAPQSNLASSTSPSTIHLAQFQLPGTIVQPLIHLPVPTFVHTPRFLSPSPMFAPPLVKSAWFPNIENPDEYCRMLPDSPLPALNALGLGAAVLFASKSLATRNLRLLAKQHLDSYYSSNSPQQFISQLVSDSLPICRSLSVLTQCTLPLMEIGLSASATIAALNYTRKWLVDSKSLQQSSQVENDLQVESALVYPLIISHSYRLNAINPAAFEQLKFDSSGEVSSTRLHLAESDLGNQEILNAALNEYLPQAHVSCSDVALDVPIPVPQAPNTLFDCFETSNSDDNSDTYGSVMNAFTNEVTPIARIQQDEAKHIKAQRREYPILHLLPQWCASLSMYKCAGAVGLGLLGLCGSALSTSLSRRVLTSAIRSGLAKPLRQSFERGIKVTSQTTPSSVRYCAESLSLQHTLTAFQSQADTMITSSALSRLRALSFCRIVVSSLFMVHLEFSYEQYAVLFTKFHSLSRSLALEYSTALSNLVPDTSASSPHHVTPSIYTPKAVVAENTVRSMYSSLVSALVNKFKSDIPLHADQDDAQRDRIEQFSSTFASSTANLCANLPNGEGIYRNLRRFWLSSFHHQPDAKLVRDMNQFVASQSSSVFNSSGASDIASSATQTVDESSSSSTTPMVAVWSNGPKSLCPPVFISQNNTQLQSSSEHPLHQEQEQQQEQQPSSSPPSSSSSSSPPALPTHLPFLSSLFQIFLPVHKQTPTMWGTHIPTVPASALTTTSIPTPSSQLNQYYHQYALWMAGCTVISLCSAPFFSPARLAILMRQIDSSQPLSPRQTLSTTPRFNTFQQRVQFALKRFGQSAQQLPTTITTFAKLITSTTRATTTIPMLLLLCGCYAWLNRATKHSFANSFSALSQPTIFNDHRSGVDSVWDMEQTIVNAFDVCYPPNKHLLAKKVDSALAQSFRVDGLLKTMQKGPLALELTPEAQAQAIAHPDIPVPIELNKIGQTLAYDAQVPSIVVPDFLDKTAMWKYFPAVLLQAIFQPLPNLPSKPTKLLASSTALHNASLDSQQLPFGVAQYLFDGNTDKETTRRNELEAKIQQAKQDQETRLINKHINQAHAHDNTASSNQNEQHNDQSVVASPTVTDDQSQPVSPFEPFKLDSNDYFYSNPIARSNLNNMLELDRDVRELRHIYDKLNILMATDTSESDMATSPDILEKARKLEALFDIDNSSLDDQPQDSAVVNKTGANPIYFLTSPL